MGPLLERVLCGPYDHALTPSRATESRNCSEPLYPSASILSRFRGLAEMLLEVLLLGTVLHAVLLLDNDEMLLDMVVVWLDGALEAVGLVALSMALSNSLRIPTRTCAAFYLNHAQPESEAASGHTDARGDSGALASVSHGQLETSAITGWWADVQCGLCEDRLGGNQKRIGVAEKLAPQLYKTWPRKEIDTRTVLHSITSISRMLRIHRWGRVRDRA
jgi:hypothetical protein